MQLQIILHIVMTVALSVIVHEVFYYAQKKKHIIVFRILKAFLMNFKILIAIIRSSMYMRRCFLKMSMKVKVNILTHRMIYYIKVFFQVIKMKRKYLKVSQKVAKIVLNCVDLNIAGNTRLKLLIIGHCTNYMMQNLTFYKTCSC